MAFNSSNRIRSVVVGEFEDHISPETSKAQARVSSDMEKMAKSAGSFMKAIVGLVALGAIKQIFAEMVNFASEHQTTVTGQINKMKMAYNAFMTGLVETPLFGQLIDRITEALSFAAVLIQNSAAWDAFLILLRAKWNLFTYGVKQSFIEVFSFNSEMIAAMFGNNPGAVAAAMAKKALADPVTKVMVDAADQASADFSKAFNNGLKNLKVSAALGEVHKEFFGLNEDLRLAQVWMRQLDQDAQLTRDDIADLANAMAKVPKVDTPKFKSDPIKMQNAGMIAARNEMMEQRQAALDAAAANYEFGGSILGLASAFDEMKSKAVTAMDIMAGMRDFVTGALVESFSFLGATLVGLGGGFNAFFARMLGQLGDFAVKTGAIMIAYGLGLKALFKFSGSGSIAAGLALIALGGALKAISANMQKLGSGQSDTGNAPSSARDYSTDRNSGGRKSGDTIVNVHINGDVMTLDKMDTDKRFNELALKIGKSLDRQTNTLDRGFV